MINRALIRLKVVQLTYAYYQNEGKATEVALKELDYSLNKAYDLYHSLLALLVELRRLAQHKMEVKSQNTLHTTQGNDALLAGNQFLQQLEDCKALTTWRAKQKTSWADADKFLRRLYEAFVADEAFITYVDHAEHTYEDDRELIRRLYKNHVLGNDAFEDILEEQSLYWNDDKEIVDSFVMKTIKRFDPANGAEQELLPAYAAKEDQEFASRLFLTTIERADELRDMMRHNTRNWDFNRMALMDIIIIQIAAAEVLAFPTIPLNVTFNEYIDIARYYSTPRSPGYVHGMLDTITKQLKAEGKVLK